MPSSPPHADVRRSRVIASLVVSVLGLAGAGLVVTTTCLPLSHDAVPRDAPDAGRSDPDAGPSDASVPPHRATLWVGSRGRCRLVDGTLECCGREALDGLRAPNVNGVWMGYPAHVCYAKANGGGECVTYRHRYEIPSETTAVSAVLGPGGAVCVLTAAGAVECLSDGAWSVVMERADRLDATVHYVFALASGDIWCWGEDPFEICVGPPAHKLTDVGDIVAIETSLMGHVCGLRRGGAVLCWGGNDVVHYSRRLEHSAITPRYVKGIAPITWLRRVGLAAFCGGGDAPSDTLQCWGFGQAPLLGLARHAVVGHGPGFFDGTAFHLERPVVDVAGSDIIGCSIGTDGTESCVTNIEPDRLHCGARLLPHLFDEWLDTLFE